MSDNPRRMMTDPELIALAALVNAEAAMMNGENQQRQLHGEAPAYVGMGDYAQELLWALEERRTFRYMREEDVGMKKDPFYHDPPNRGE